MTIKSLNLWLTGKKYDQALDKSSRGRIDDDNDDDGWWPFNQFIYSFIGAFGVRVEKVLSLSECISYWERVGCCVCILFHRISIYFHQKQLEMYDFISFSFRHGKSDGKKSNRKIILYHNPINEI